MCDANEKVLTHAGLSKVMMRIKCIPASSNVTYQWRKPKKTLTVAFELLLYVTADSDVTTHLCGTI